MIVKYGNCESYLFGVIVFFCSKCSDIMLAISSSVFQGIISVCSAASCNIKHETKGTHHSVPIYETQLFFRDSIGCDSDCILNRIRAMKGQTTVPVPHCCLHDDGRPVWMVS